MLKLASQERRRYYVIKSVIIIKPVQIMMNVLIMPVANYWASCHYSWMLNKKRQV